MITGCLRISKESIFTGLNNLRANSILDKKYAEHFGFEEYEVKEMLHYYDLDGKFELIKRWHRALEQINEKDYTAKARSMGYKNILKYGVAFKNKVCYAAMEKFP